MPTSHTPKSFVREDVMRAVDEAKEEVFATLESLRTDFEQSKVESKDSLEKVCKVVASVQEQIQGAVTKLNLHNSKISLLMEGDVRAVIRLERGDAWAASTRLASASCVINHIADLTGRADLWKIRSKDQVIDILKSSDAIKRVVELLQLSFLNVDDYEGWEPLRSSVLRHPLIDNEGKIITGHLARLIHPAPPHLQNVLIELVQMLDAQPSDDGQDILDYNHFLTTEASLMCLVMLSDEAFKIGAEIPPHQLQFDCQGSITLEYPTAIIEAGEIKSSTASFREAEVQLYRRFKLLAFILPIIDSEVKNIHANGWTYAVYTDNDYKRPMRKTMPTEIDGALRYQIHRYIVQDFWRLWNSDRWARMVL